MNLFQFSIVSALAANLALGILAYITHPRRLINQTFFALAIVLAAWLSCLGFGSASKQIWEVEFWIRQSSAVSALIPIAMNLLLLSILDRKANWMVLLKRSHAWLLSYATIVILCQTKFFLISASLPPSGHTVAQPQYGMGFILFAGYFTLALAVLVYRYISEMKRATGIQRTELQFVLMGCTGGLLFGIVFLLFPVLLNNIEIAQLLPLSVIVQVMITAYGIATRRIMDVPQVLRRLTAYALVIAYLSLLYFAVWYGADYVFQTVFESHLPIPHLLAALAVALSMAPAHGRMQRFANSLFVNINTIDVSETMQKANVILNSITTLDDLLEQFSALIAQAVGTDRVLILLGDNGRFIQRHPKDQSLLQLDRQNVIVTQLLADREPLVLDVLNRMRPNPQTDEAARRMEEIQASVVVGIHTKSGLDGVLLLGPRLSGRIYGKTEQQALRLLCDHLAVALENSKLYTQVQDSMIYNNILLDNLVGGVVAASADRVVTVFNREAQRITGLAPADILRKSIDVLPPALADALQITFESGAGLRDHDLTLRLNGKDEIPVRAGSALFHSHTGKILGALLVFNDLTMIKKLEQQVRRTDRLASLGTLSAGMAHEIKNPLVTLKTFTQLLPERYEDQDFRETFSSLVGQEVKRIDTIVNQLLRFARPAKPSLAPMHIHDMLDNVLRLVQQQLRQHDIELVRDYRAPNDVIQGDADLLVQAFINFFLNAIEAMDEHGQLTLSTERVEQQGHSPNPWGQRNAEPFIRINITDTGRGIKPEDLPHVFDPFFTTKSTGTGLGLSVAHGIIHDHGGVIDVESVVSKGTTFHLTFPLVKEGVPA